MRKSKPSAACAIPAMLFAVAVLAGCGASHSASGHESEPPLPAVRPVTSYAQVNRPLDAFLPDPDQQVQLQQLYYSTLNQCLTSGGLEPLAEPEGMAAFILAAAREGIIRSNTWGFYDTDNYREYGYRRPPSVPGALVFPIASGDSPAAAQCKEDAQPIVAAVRAASLDYLPDGGPKSPIGDSRYREANTQWVACMAERGYRYDSPQDAQSDIQSDLYTVPESTAHDIATAIADIECKNEVNLVGIAMAIQAAYDQHYIDSHLTALSAIRDRYLAALAG